MKSWRLAVLVAASLISEAGLPSCAAAYDLVFHAGAIAQGPNNGLRNGIDVGAEVVGPVGGAFRGGLMVSYQAGDLSRQSDATVLVVAAGGRYSRPLGRLRPYVGAGLGAYVVDVSAETSGPSGGTRDWTGTKLGFPLTLGFVYPLRNEWQLGAAATNHAVVVDAGASGGGDLWSYFSLSVTLGYAFGRDER